jgi:Single-strand binding protein family
MIPLACPHCGACDVPLLGPGRGPHAAAASCRACGRFLKWLPQALVDRKKGVSMASVNRVILLGTIGKYGIDMRYSSSGTACAAFTLAVVEVGQDGKEHTTLVPCECWGKKAEGVSELEAGALVLFEGKLVKRKKGEAWELIVSGFEVTPIAAPVAMIGSTN